MKICMLAPEFIPVWGGVGTYIVELLKHLPGNIEVHVVAPTREGFAGQKGSKCNLAFPKYFGSNVHIHFICMAKDTFYYNGRFQYECFKQVPKILKEEQIDLIHSHTAHMPDLLLMFRKLNKPIVTTVHSTIKYQRMGTKTSMRTFSDLERSEKATFLAYPVLRLCEEIYFRRKRLYISPSNWMKQWLNDNTNINDPISVIPNSVDVDGYKNASYTQVELEAFSEKLADKRIILFVGRLIALKGIDVLMDSNPESFETYRRKHRPFCFCGPRRPSSVP